MLKIVTVLRYLLGVNTTCSTPTVRPVIHVVVICVTGVICQLGKWKKLLKSTQFSLTTSFFFVLNRNCVIRKIVNML